MGHSSSDETHQMDHQLARRLAPRRVHWLTLGDLPASPSALPASSGFAVRRDSAAPATGKDDRDIDSDDPLPEAVEDLD